MKFLNGLLLCPIFSSSLCPSHSFIFLYFISSFLVLSLSIYVSINLSSSIYLLSNLSVCLSPSLFHSHSLSLSFFLSLFHSHQLINNSCLRLLSSLLIFFFPLNTFSDFSIFSLFPRFFVFFPLHPHISFSFCKVAYFFAEALNKRNSKSSRKDSNNHNHNHNHSYSSSNNSGSNSGFGSGSQRNSSTSGRSGSFGNHLPDQKKQKL